MAARTNKIRHDENTRLKIKTSQIINRVQNHIFGKIDLTSTQVQCALGLLKKTVPDLTKSETTVTRITARELPDDELANIAARGSEGAPVASVDPQKLN